MNVAPRNFAFGIALQITINLLACRTPSGDTNLAASEQLSTQKIGILLASHGDIDDPKTELEDYIKTSFKKNVGIPLPDWSRDTLTNPAYFLSVKTVREQYEIIGPTRYRENAYKQAAALDKALKSAGLAAKAYVGFNFTKPFIEDTFAQMRADGITTVVVFNKGAQFSYASSGENMEDSLNYLNQNPDFDARVIGYRQYSDDDRFRSVMAAAIERDIKAIFPGEAPNNICVMIASHGLPQWLIDKGDPAIQQMRSAFEAVKAKLPPYKMYHGYLNDDFFPGARWVAPKATVLAYQLRRDQCRNIYLDSRLSFTNHHRATLYDLNYEVRNILEKAPFLPTGRLDPNWQKPKVVLATNFDDDTTYATLIADLSKEALAGKGPIVMLKDLGKPAMAKGTVGKPGVKPN